jgi:spore coat protein CotH
VIRRIGAVIACVAVGVAVSDAQVRPSADDLFDGSTLHDVWIHINSRDWAQLRATPEADTYYPCDFEWRALEAYNAGCRSRGNYTRNGIKPGLRVEFEHYVTGQTFLGLTSLVLDNFWQDPSMLKERIVMQLFQRMGVPSSREAHARLYIGPARDYVGVYALVEDVNEQFLVRQFGGCGGHPYEYQWQGPYGFEDLGPNLDGYAALFEAKNHEQESTFALYAPIRDLIGAITGAGPERLEQDLDSYLDVRTFLRHAAVENFVSEWDGLLGTWGLNNFYLYRPPGSTRSVLVPWDQDNSFVWLEMPPWNNVETNVLMSKAWESPPLQAFYLQQLMAVSGLSDWMLEEVGRESSLIRDAALADPLKNSTNEEFDEAVRQLAVYAQQRTGIIREYVRGMPR